MKYRVLMSVRGNANADYLRFAWAGAFTYRQSIMAKRLPDDHKVTEIDGTVSDIELLIEYVRRMGSAVLDFRMAPISE